MDEPSFDRLVALACHDLRSPLATAGGVAKLLIRTGELAEREARLAGMVDAAATEMASMIDKLSLAASIVGGRYDPPLRDADTLELASTPDQRVTVSGSGEIVATDGDAVSGALAGLAVAVLRHGEIATVGWRVSGRTLELTPVPAQAAPIVDGSSARDLDALVGRLVLEALGASVVVSDATLRIELA